MKRRGSQVSSALSFLINFVIFFLVFYLMRSDGKHWRVSFIDVCSARALMQHTLLGNPLD
jgi:predicted PurR-regulated permease PerM